MEQEMESDIWEGLPEDVLIRVLACLRTLVVVKLRAVCKRWNQLISSAHTFPPNVPLSSTPAFLICWSHWLTSYPKYLVIGGSYDCPPTTHLSRLSLHFLPTQLDSFKVVATCKSLLCCSYDQQPATFYICNPSSRTFIQLPPPHHLTAWDFIALAFDSSTRRCNLVIGRKYVTQCPYFNTVVEIYDSQANSWTQLQMTIGQSINPYGEGVYSKGKVYWINATPIDVVRSRYNVVGFCVEEGRWEVIMRPGGPSQGYPYFWQLTGQDGMVILVHKKDLSLWKLNEDGDEGYDGKRCRWSAMPMGCLSDFAGDDLSSQTCVQVVANCSGWILVYLRKKWMVVVDEKGGIVRKAEGKELRMLAGSDGCPTSVSGFEANNVWWPS